VIITDNNCDSMVDNHDRRPVVLTPELAREWLAPATPKRLSEQMALCQGELGETFEGVQSRHGSGITPSS